MPVMQIHFALENSELNMLETKIWYLGGLLAGFAVCLNGDGVGRHDRYEL